MLLTTIDWKLPGSYARIAKNDPTTYYLEFGGIDHKTFESFSGHCYIRKGTDCTTRKKWIGVPQNPFVEQYDTKVLYGGSPSIVAKKVLRQIEKWREEYKQSGKEPEQHKVQEQSTGEEDCLPFC